MKKNVVRVLALVLVALMCLSLVPLAAHAEAHVHEMAEDHQDPTCVDNGFNQTYCPICNATFSMEYIPATGIHSFMNVEDEQYLIHEGDCEHAYQYWKSCSVCQQSAEEAYAKALDELYEELNNRKNRGEQADWEQIVKDRVLLLDEKYKFSYGGEGHHYVHVDHQEATCTSDGWKEYSYCDVCGEYFNYESIPAKGHRWGEYTQTKAPTCTEAGEKVRVCEVCDEKDVVVLPALGHAWGEFKVTKEATCTEDGSRERVCSVCNEKEIQVIPAAHKFGAYVVTLEPTCFVDGSRERVCTVCGHKEVEAIPAAHTYGEFTVTQEPTCYSTGAKTATCTVCGEEHTEWIDMVPHKYENGECVFCHEAMPEGYVAPSDDRTEITETANTETENTDNQTTEPETVDNQAAEPETADNQTAETTAPEQQGVEPAAEAAPVNTVTITFDGNGATGGSMEPQAFAEGSVQALSANAFTRDGYLFLGWDVAADGSAMGEDRFLDGEAVEVNSDVTLYAQWREINADVETQQTEASAETVSSFENVLNAQGLTEIDPSAMVVQNVTPLNENGEKMSNEEVAARGGVIFDMPLPDTYEEGHEIEVYHQNSETGEWERVTTYTVQGDKVIVCLKHFSPVVTLDRTAIGGTLSTNDSAMLGANNVTKIEIYKTTDSDTPVSEAKYGDTLRVAVQPASTAYKYQWYRIVTEGADPAIISGATNSTYAPTKEDVPYYINCSVYEDDPTDAKSADNSVHMRLDVPFPVNILGLGTVVTTNEDKPNNLPAVTITKEHTSNPESETFYINALTENEVNLMVTPASGKVIRYVKENGTTIISASKNPKTYNIKSVAKSQETHQFNVYFDDYNVNVSETTAMLPSDISTDKNADIKKSFLDAYVNKLELTDDEYAYYYVTPCWNGSPATPISDNDIIAIGGFTFFLDMPKEVTPSNYSTYDVHVYHYVKNTNTWENVSFTEDYATIDGVDKIRAKIENFSSFSPFAIVAVPSISVNFDANGGAGEEMPAETGVKGEKIIVPKCTYVAPLGHTFLKWNTETNGSGDSYKPGDEITLDEPMTLFAQWAEGFTITFNDNDSDNTDTYGTLVTGEMDEQHIYTDGTKYYNEEGEELTEVPTLNTNQFSLKNHQFKGWSTASGSGNVVVYEDRNKIDDSDKAEADRKPITANTTLYAVWERTQVSISYNANGGSGSDMADQSAPKNSSVKLRTNTYTAPYSNQMFAGWSTTPTGNVEYTDGQTIDAPASDITLYAVWRDKVTIHFYPDSDSGTGTGTMTDQIVPSGVETALKANGFTAPSGKAFVEWNERKDGTGKGYANKEKVTLTGDTYLYAQWKDGIKLSYDPNGGTLRTSAGEFTTARSWTIPQDEEYTLYTQDELKLTYDGYEFEGWALTASAKTPKEGWEKTNEPITVAEGFSKDTTIYAVWKRVKIADTVTISGDKTGSDPNAIWGETLTANVFDPVFKTGFTYTWKVGDIEVQKGESNELVVLPEYYGKDITCTVSHPQAENEVVSNIKTVGVYAVEEDGELRIVNSSTKYPGLYYEVPLIFGAIPGSTYYKDGKAATVPESASSGAFPITEPGVYVFGDTTYVATQWWTIGYSSSSGSGDNSGSGNTTMKRGSTTLTSSTRIKSGDVTLLEPYNTINGYSNVWLVRDGSSITDITLTVKPASSSYGHVSRNGSGFNSSGSEQIISLGTIDEPELYEVIYNKSSSSPRTGDMSNLGLWSALCLVSFVGVTTILTSARKRKNRG